MTRISSSWTFFYKRVFPAIWFGFLALFLCAAVGNAVAQNNAADLLPVLVVTGVMVIIGIVVMKQFVWDLADEVWDDGDGLVVRNKGREERFALADFMKLSYSGLVNPPRITLALRNPSELGTEISFVPPFRILSFSMPPIARDLMERIDAARRRSD